MANTHKGTTKPRTMIENEGRTRKILGLSATNTTTMETIRRNHELTIQGVKKIRAQMIENAKLQILLLQMRILRKWFQT